MTTSTERRSRKERDADLPPALSSLWRMTKLAYSIEPRLLVVSIAMTLALALPQSLIGLWLAVLVDGLHDHDRSNVYLAAAGLAVSATLMWWLQVVFDRLSRRFRSPVGGNSAGGSCVGSGEQVERTRLKGQNLTRPGPWQT